MKLLVCEVNINRGVGQLISQDDAANHVPSEDFVLATHYALGLAIRHEVALGVDIDNFVGLTFH
jgi:hypothetical protein